MISGLLRITQTFLAKVVFLDDKLNKEDDDKPLSITNRLVMKIQKNKTEYHKVTMTKLTWVDRYISCTRAFSIGQTGHYLYRVNCAHSTNITLALPLWATEPIFDAGGE